MKFFESNQTCSSLRTISIELMYQIRKGLERSARSLEQRWQIPTPFLVSSAGDRLSRSSPLSSNPFTTTRRSQPLSTHVQASTDSRRFFFEAPLQPRRRRFSPLQARRRPIARDTSGEVARVLVSHIERVAEPLFCRRSRMTEHARRLARTASVLTD